MVLYKFIGDMARDVGMRAFVAQISICNTRGFKQQLFKEALKQMQEDYQGSELENVDLQFPDQMGATTHIPDRPLIEVDTRLQPVLGLQTLFHEMAHVMAGFSA